MKQPPCAARCAVDGHKRASLKALVAAALACADGIGDAMGATDDDAPRAGDRLVPVDGGAEPMRAADLALGDKQRFAWPYDTATGRARDRARSSRVLLIRLDPAAMDEPTRQRAADGVLAYSALCTHGECYVSEWRPARGTLLCACHFSHFLPLQGAAVASGPARDPLPALPLRIQDGRLVVAGGFSERPGGR